jgi:hypothetical protein
MTRCVALATVLVTGVRSRLSDVSWLSPVIDGISGNRDSSPVRHSTFGQGNGQGSSVATGHLGRVVGDLCKFCC